MHKVAVCRRETAFQGGYRTYESKKEKKESFLSGPNRKNFIKGGRGVARCLLRYRDIQCPTLHIKVFCNY